MSLPGLQLKLDVWDHELYADSDIIAEVGRELGRQQRFGADYWVTAWVERHPTRHRREIAGWFLMGYWAFVRRVSVVALASLIEGLEAERHDPVGYPYQAQLRALFALADSPADNQTLEEITALRRFVAAELRWFRQYGLSGFEGLLEHLETPV
jgi:hypothetical protein